MAERLKIIWISFAMTCLLQFARLCGKRPAGRDITVREIHSCALCRDHVFLGENLVKNAFVFIAEKDTEFPGKRLFEPIFGKFQLYFSNSDPSETKHADKIMKFWCP